MPTKLVYFSNSGVAATGLTLTWEYLLKVADGTAFTPQPAFTEVGGGWYKFSIAPTESLVGVVDGSATLTISAERYQPVYFDIYDYLYEVLLDPVYDEDSDALTFFAFLLQNGKRITASLTNCSISVYNSAHVLQFTISAVSNTNGVFVLSKSTPGLVKNTGYYAVATITCDGVDHPSIDTYISLE